MRKRTVSLAIAATLIFASLTCAHAFTQDNKTMKSGEKKEVKEKKETSLYTRLGRKQGLMKVLDDFLVNVQADNRINKLFADTVQDPKRVEAFKNNLYSQICQAGGGRCKYKGKDMKTAHKGMNIKDADFNALVENLTKALDKNGVGEKEKNELLAVLGPMKSEIVGQ